MHLSLLRILRCPRCGGELTATCFEDDGGEVAVGLLRCDSDRGGALHWFPVVGGIPRMLPDALAQQWPVIAPHVGSMPPGDAAAVSAAAEAGNVPAGAYDVRTRDNFTLEWSFHEGGDRTWGIDVDERVQRYFVDSIRIPVGELEGKVVLDAGCGNGSQSVAYTELGLEVVAMDLSTGVDQGRAFAHRRPEARLDHLHFVQADLQSPPLAPGSFDLIHSAGVLHHTPDTEHTFRVLCRLLRPGGRFYIWLYKREPRITSVVNGIRVVTTRIPPARFARLAQALGGTFRAFCSATNRLGIRSYPPLTQQEATVALMDIFGAPHAHSHSFEEVARWYESEGFVQLWPCNDDRRGFGACGRLPATADERRSPLVPTPSA